MTYSSSRPDALATFGAPDQRWVTALGNYDGDRADLKVEMTTGGSFNSSVPMPSQQTDYGTMKIVVSNCNLITVEYDFPTANEPGSFSASRVVDSNVPLCESLN